MKRISLIVSALLAAMLSATCATHQIAPSPAAQCAGMTMDLSHPQRLCAA